MIKYVTHLAVFRKKASGAKYKTSLCGRMRIFDCVDNLVFTLEETTCSFCRRKAAVVDISKLIIKSK